MDRQHYEIVTISTYTYELDKKTVDEKFKQIFGGAGRTKRTFNTNCNSITVFYVQSKHIDRNAIGKFESFLKEEGFVKLLSTVFSDPSGGEYAHFFTIKLDLEYFADMRDLFISKIEAILGKKILIYEDVYYFYVTKNLAKSKKLMKLLDKLMNNPIVNTIIVI